MSYAPSLGFCFVANHCDGIPDIHCCPMQRSRFTDYGHASKFKMHRSTSLAVVAANYLAESTWFNSAAPAMLASSALLEVLAFRLQTAPSGLACGHAAA